METKAGNVVWFEVIGKDAKGLQSFYNQLFGWTLKDDPNAPPGYGLAQPEQTGLPGGIGASPSGGDWATFYVQVDDIDATLKIVGAQGGKTVQPPMTMPDGDKIAMLSDPEGHVIGLFQKG